VVLTTLYMPCSIKGFIVNPSKIRSIYIHMYMYIYMCIYVYIYVHICSCMHMYIYIYMYTCGYICMYITIPTYTPIWISIHVYKILPKIHLSLGFVPIKKHSSFYKRAPHKHDSFSHTRRQAQKMLQSISTHTATDYNALQQTNTLCSTHYSTQ